MNIFAIDWHAMWVPTMGLLDIVLRGTVVYFALWIFFRVIRRGATNVGVTDILLVVLIADASQQAMASEYRSITEGLVLVGTLVFWDMLLDWLSFRYRWMEKLIEPRPLPLVRDGVMLHRNMRKEMITREELFSQLRLQGIADISEVKLCHLESNGQLSAIKRKGEPAPSRKPQGRPA
ncbi:DUF421 domain-containing protein [Usitatibacter palustris]|uniref:YetF C-terminal domain-containing protein n=1 Tax=Usitatibacter palustris TaxID=2732487 RepID=A0A6M4HB82_9PROT|nr:YetF domain-containing protein [Usitatibacter palustris]QJR16950.1 hypothetical protein DSM104440_03787 [Usitatibacter palustris]